MEEEEEAEEAAEEDDGGVVSDEAEAVKERGRLLRAAAEDARLADAGGDVRGALSLSG